MAGTILGEHEDMQGGIRARCLSFLLIGQIDGLWRTLRTFTLGAADAGEARR